MGEQASEPQPLHLETPLLKSRKLSEKVHANVWLKLENCQNSGSFKVRGLGLLAQKVKSQLSFKCDLYRVHLCARERRTTVHVDYTSLYTIAGHSYPQAKTSGCTSFASSSGGNAGLAAAYCARELSLPITVVVPQTTPSFIVDKLREEGAAVEVVGKVRFKGGRAGGRKTMGWLGGV